MITFNDSLKENKKKGCFTREAEDKRATSHLYKRAGSDCHTKLL